MASSMGGSRAPRRISPAEAAALVKSGDWVDYGFGMGQPDALDMTLAARRDELNPATPRLIKTVRGVGCVFTADARRV
jgi:acyl-CoA hydrolase